MILSTWMAMANAVIALGRHGFSNEQYVDSSPSLQLPFGDEAVSIFEEPLETSSRCSEDCWGNGLCLQADPPRCLCQYGTSSSDCSVWECLDCTHGTCVEHPENLGTVFCRCDPGWSGRNCDKKKCSECLHGGVCAEDGLVCACPHPWLPPDCSTQDCSSCKQGSCNDNTNYLCVCQPNWGGLDCSEDFSGCPNMCSGHGICMEGVCHCQNDYSGSDCSWHCPKACLEHGRCIEGGWCECEEGYFGPLCEEVSCLHSNSTLSCSGHGVCFENHCYCDQGWAGDMCEIKLCPGQCHGKGICLEGRCVCLEGEDEAKFVWNQKKPISVQQLQMNDLTFHAVEARLLPSLPDLTPIGTACEQLRCTSNCGQEERRGWCDHEYGACLCRPGFVGFRHFDCAYKLCDAESYCGGHGVCVGEGQCVCDPGGLAPNGWQGGWIGPNCSQPLCPHSCNSESNRGFCTARGCQCRDGFWGYECSKKECPHADVQGKLVRCGGKERGTCYEGECACRPQWTGIACEVSTCPNQCSGRGLCQGGTCLCPADWTAEDCSVFRNGSLGTGCPNDCHVEEGKGVCKAGRCLCLADNFHGIDCSLQHCGKCSKPGGVCNTGTGFCDCISGWRGEDCGEQWCDPVDCGGEHHGTCVFSEDGNHPACQCIPPWTGLGCDQLMCIDECSGHGVCVQKKRACYCSSRYKGSSCETDKCPDSCSGHGLCTSEGCRCDYGWQGNNCSKGMCLHDCSGNGKCAEGKISGEPTCVCHGNWTGPACLDLKCEDDCGPYGSCVNDGCLCDLYHRGTDCMEEVCPRSCGKHGTCSLDIPLAFRSVAAAEGCSCDVGWTGEDCSHRIKCKIDCGPRGTCSGGGLSCVCDPGWRGARCSRELCPNECSPPRGACHSEALNPLAFSFKHAVEGCVCQEGWSGEDCSVEVCKPSSDCSGRGSCVRGRCQCDGGFEGSACETELCDLDCGHGACINSTCICEQGYSGEYCSCVGTCEGQPCGLPCANDATCLNGRCQCTLGWKGEFCEDFACGPDRNCSNHGICVQSEAQDKQQEVHCVCEAGRTGAFCEFELPSRVVACPEDCARMNKGYCNYPHSDANQNQRVRWNFAFSVGCVCDQDWRGPKCEEEVPCGSQGCGRGICIATLRSTSEQSDESDIGRLFVCRCPEGWRGLHCEEEICPWNCSYETVQHGVCDPRKGCICDNDRFGWGCQKKCSSCEFPRVVLRTCYGDRDTVCGLAALAPSQPSIQDPSAHSLTVAWREGDDSWLGNCEPVAYQVQVAEFDSSKVPVEVVPDWRNVDSNCFPPPQLSCFPTDIIVTSVTTCLRRCAVEGLAHQTFYSLRVGVRCSLNSTDSPFSVASVPFATLEKDDFPCGARCAPSGPAHGTCSVNLQTQMGVCVCESGWTGDDCTVSACEAAGLRPDCGAHGRCNERGLCVCDVPWTGLNCTDLPCEHDQRMKALKAAGGVGLDCGHHGICLNMECRCAAGWWGESCEQEACVSNCSGRGFCVEPDHSFSCGTGQLEFHTRPFSESLSEARPCCRCNETGWYGPACDKYEIAACAILGWGDCGGPERGHCYREDDRVFCRCRGRWQGENCTDLPCGRKCDNGECFNDLCRCKKGWYGHSCNLREDCDESECMSTSTLASPPLHNRGFCELDRTRPGLVGKWNCSSPFLGPACGDVRCDFGCNGHGTCINFGCQCHEGWFGQNCELKGSLKLCPESSWCSHRGHCLYLETPNQEIRCLCDVGYGGQHCELAMLVDSFCHQAEVKVADTRLQSFGAICVQTEGVPRLMCPVGRTGSTCSDLVCTLPCGNGVCSNFACKCDHGWMGDTCSVAYSEVQEWSLCPGYSNATNGATALSAPRVCSGHGVCINVTTESNVTLFLNTSFSIQCRCHVGFTGPECAEPLCQVPCSKNAHCVERNTCGSAGRQNAHCVGGNSCTGGGICVCNEGWLNPPVCDIQGELVPQEQLPHTGCGLTCSGPEQGLCVLDETSSVGARCQCLKEFTGENCSEYACNGVLCSANKTCIGGECVCDPFSETFGEFCQFGRCPNDCSSHGKCDNLSRDCKCEIGWKSESCVERMTARECLLACEVFSFHNFANLCKECVNEWTAESRSLALENCIRDHCHV
eukprot:gb/GEZN01000141.1/.p1 GENE.gb/GEZN01000141.1/~~gb/GEZN01000141.1/.p1  ORF type:complete len:2115 (+),score=54.91 gb/GEZN01000141.1/:104-6448(+)